MSFPPHYVINRMQNHIVSLITACLANFPDAECLEIVNKEALSKIVLNILLLDIFFKQKGLNYHNFKSFTIATI